MLFWFLCGKAKKKKKKEKEEEERKRDEKWQEREGRAVNLQTVVLHMLALSCDSRANIMVSLCRAQWEF